MPRLDSDHNPSSPLPKGATRYDRGYLGMKEAARWANVSVRTLKRWIARGLPTYQAGPREKILIRPEDIDHFLIKQARTKPDLHALVEEAMRALTSPSAQLGNTKTMSHR